VKRSLVLKKETVKVLAEAHLREVAGGTSNSWGGCPTNGCTDWSVWQTCNTTHKIEDY
jgi:hypothetical protein